MQKQDVLYYGTTYLSLFVFSRSSSELLLHLLEAALLTSTLLYNHNMQYYQSQRQFHQTQH
jgi:hypothetical protein